MRTLTLWVLSMLALALYGPPAGAEERIDFAHDVLPVIKAHCGKCHTNGTYKGGISFDTREALLKSEAAVPGKSGKSLLVERITAGDPRMRMPPKGEPLTARQIATLKTWIDQGLAWQEGFSFADTKRIIVIAPRRPELPPAIAGRDNPIDRIIDAYHVERRIPTPPTVEDRVFMRRLYLDVVGLLPTVEEQDAFLADTSADKRGRLIRKVLADRRAYAEHWLTFWNDLLRNDYAGTGYIDGGRRQITGWLYRSLMENKPYDQFVRELIDPSPEAEGFIRGIKWRGRVNASQKREVQFAQNVAQVFLGINLKCASCHNSFINQWKLKDAYGLAAVVADGPLEINRCDKPTGETARAKFLFPELGAIDPGRPRKERLGRLAVLMTSPKNGLLARTIVNRLWQRLMGRGIVHPVDVMANPPWNADLLDYLASHLVENEYDLKKTIELIVSSQAYQARSAPLSGEKDLAEEYVFRGPIARRLTAEQFVDAVWRLTGTAPARPSAKVGDRGGEPVRAALVVADPLMRSLGRPNREQVVTTRPADLSTLQALDLTNGPVLAGLLGRGAQNLRKRHPGWDAGQMTTHVFRSALCRRPTAEEREVARKLLGEPMTDEGLSDLLWAVIMLPEFQLVR
jgi:hypothetical protein